MAIFISDAVPTVNMADVMPAGIAAKIAGIDIVMILVGTPLFTDESNAMAIASSPAARNIINIINYDILPNITNTVIAATCNDFNECNSNPCLFGGTCVSGYGQYNCICPMSATGLNCQMTCSRQMDVVFVLDLSGSDNDWYNTIVSLTTQIIVGFDVTNYQVRVAVVTYSSQVDDYFYLNAYTGNLQNLLYAIDFDNPGGTTNTQAALLFVLNSVLTATNGDRQGTPNIVVYIGDGNSDVPEGSTPTANAASLLQKSGATIYSIGLGDNQYPTELNAIARPDDGPQNTLLLHSANASNVTSVANQMLSIICT
jgi:hypothetical protein